MASGGRDFDGVLFDPAAARDAAARLDGLAARLEAELREGSPALTVPPSGADEVSVRASQTMNDVAASYGDSAAAGIVELRKLAATLRSQAAQFGRAEHDSVADFGVPGAA
ncbi:PE family protein [Nocardia sp. NBC_00565]|uniref:PE family protein n=1 Tax=Nocardia sp. NBC_00565 TaxID=2975993 RepID=UPI002E8198EA|nr:PE family protein [Nocardia sp. NBC_00565]WUC02876.1 PE family protein [Nocardia sp. NBC_00565]